MVPGYTMTDEDRNEPDIVILDGWPYDVHAAPDGMRRFVPNGVIVHLRDTGVIDETRAVTAADGLSPHDLAEILAGLGCTVEELLSYPAFEGWSEEPSGGIYASGFPAFQTVVDGVNYDLCEDDDGRLSFEGNKVLRALIDTDGLDLDMLDTLCVSGKFDTAEYVSFLSLLGMPFVDAIQRAPLRACVITDEDGNAVVLPDRAFLAVHAEPAGDLHPARDAIGLRGLGDAVLYATPLGKCDHAPLHAYMQRRFGFPSGDGDPHKDMCGSWCLTTPDPGLYLLVSPGPGPRFLNFSPYLVTPPGVGCDGQPITVPPERAMAMRSAYRTALVDLLRPVPVDDHWLVALGEVERGTPLMDLAPEGDRHTFEAPCDPGSAKGIPAGLAGTRDWEELMGMLRHLGNGAEPAGLARVVEAGRGIILSEVRAAPSNVRILVAAGAWGPRRDKVWEGLRLGADGERVARDVATAFLRLAPPDAPEPVLPDFTEAETVEATGLLAALAIDAPMTEAWRRYHHSRRLRREYEVLVALAGDTPLDALLAHGGRHAAGGYDALPGKLREVGATALADHVGHLLADPEGHEYLSLVLSAYLSRSAGSAPDGA